MSAAKGVINAAETILSGGKKITDAGAEMKNTLKGYATNIQGSTIAANAAKWGIPVGAIGTAAYVIPTAAGAGVTNLSDSITGGFGLDFSTEEKAAASYKKLTGWAIAALLVVLMVIFIAPRIKKLIK